MVEEESFRIVIDQDIGKLAMLDDKDLSHLGHRIWRWVKSGAERILNLSSDGLASAANKVKDQLQLKLGGQWEVSQITLTISSSPSATITIARKSQS